MNFQTKFKLNDGNEIPVVGFGTIRVENDAIVDALKVGYRLLDTASMYKYNEEGTGDAIVSNIVDRKEIFVCSKLWTDDIRNGNTREAFFKSLNKLKTDYMDLYLIHWPAEGYLEAWKEMEKLKEEGYVKSIGVSNFRIHHLENIIKNSNTIPVINEMEINPGFQDNDTMEFCREHQIQLEASAPLGEGRYVNMIELQPMAEKYGKSVPQIILRWLLQKNIIVVPKSTKLKRIKDNCDLFDFELTNDEVAFINSLNKMERSYADPDNFNF